MCAELLKSDRGSWIEHALQKSGKEGKIMLGNFQYCNPTKLYFGEQSLTFLKEELQKYGPKVQLSYGRDSIKKNGIYDQVMELLKEAGKTVFEDP